jgi:hypothetical protein
MQRFRPQRTNLHRRDRRGPRSGGGRRGIWSCGQTDRACCVVTCHDQRSDVAGFGGAVGAWVGRCGSGGRAACPVRHRHQRQCARNPSEELRAWRARKRKPDHNENTCTHFPSEKIPLSVASPSTSSSQTAREPTHLHRQSIPHRAPQKRSADRHVRSRRHHKLRFQFVFSHCGVERNEEVDKAAESACDLPFTSPRWSHS